MSEQSPNKHFIENNNRDYPHLLQRYTRLHELSSELTSILDLDILLHRIVEAAKELT